MIISANVQNNEVVSLAITDGHGDYHVYVHVHNVDSTYVAEFTFNFEYHKIQEKLKVYNVKLDQKLFNEFLDNNSDKIIEHIRESIINFTSKRREMSITWFKNKILLTR